MTVETKTFTLADALKIDPEAFERDGVVYHAEEDEAGDSLCLDCKEHCGVVTYFEDGEEVEEVSSCCSAGVHTW